MVAPAKLQMYVSLCVKMKSCRVAGDWMLRLYFQKHCNDRSKYNCWAGKARHLGRLLGKMYAAYEGYCKERPVHLLATSSLFSVRAVNHTNCEYIEVFCLTKYIERFPYFTWC